MIKGVHSEKKTFVRNDLSSWTGSGLLDSHWTDLDLDTLPNLEGVAPYASIFETTTEFCIMGSGESQQKHIQS